MFYRTLYSASIGGMLTSIIYTCHLNNQNPYDYLIALQVQQEHVLAKPDLWLPWNYQDSLAKLVNGANQQAHAPPAENLVAA